MPTLVASAPSSSYNVLFCLFLTNTKLKLGATLLSLTPAAQPRTASTHATFWRKDGRAPPSLSSSRGRLCPVAATSSLFHRSSTEGSA